MVRIQHIVIRRLLSPHQRLEYFRPTNGATIDFVQKLDKYYKINKYARCVVTRGEVLIQELDKERRARSN